MANFEDDDDQSRLMLAYVDLVRNRIIYCAEVSFDSLSEQESYFASLPSSIEDSDWIVDFYDPKGTITKDCCISRSTAERMTGVDGETLIGRGNRREAALTASLRAISATAEAQS